MVAWSLAVPGTKINSFDPPLTAVCTAYPTPAAELALWASGEVSPDPESSRYIIDIDHVLSRLLMLFRPEVAQIWITSPHAQLSGARPIDVVKIRGAAEVLEIIDGLFQGTFD
jgi:Antitoxin Xre/MbcA/ParS C-terminal toxin-binding domain